MGNIHQMIKPKINYMHVMSKKEIEESIKKIEDWWTDLDQHLKSFLYQKFELTFEQMYCVHEFKSLSEGDIEYCNKCKLTKEK